MLSGSFRNAVRLWPKYAHQLEVAGSTHPIFTTEAMDAIYAHTRGISREINNVCTACMLNAVLRKDKLIDAMHVSRILTEFKE
jgi:type II secretory pathway predicted ATPase ExeA